MLALLLRQRARLFWNRLAKGPRRIRRLVGAGLTMVFTVGFVVLAGLNAAAMTRGEPVSTPHKVRGRLCSETL